MILASDGLWDNMFDVKVIDMVRPFIRDSDELMDPQLIAEMIAKEGEKYSHRQDYLSPFGKSARKNFLDYKGGKPDDITVIVAQIFLADKKEEEKK